MRLLIEALGAAAVVVPLIYLWTRSRVHRARWRYFCRTTEGSVVEVGLERPGNSPISIAELDPGAVDFSERLASARAEANEKAAAMNAADRH